MACGAPRHGEPQAQILAMREAYGELRSLLHKPAGRHSFAQLLELLAPYHQDQELLAYTQRTLAGWPSALRSLHLDELHTVEADTLRWQLPLVLHLTVRGTHPIEPSWLEVGLLDNLESLILDLAPVPSALLEAILSGRRLGALRRLVLNPLELSASEGPVDVLAQLESISIVAHPAISPLSTEHHAALVERLLGSPAPRLITWSLDGIVLTQSQLDRALLGTFPSLRYLHCDNCAVVEQYTGLPVTRLPEGLLELQLPHIDPEGLSALARGLHRAPQLQIAFCACMEPGLRHSVEAKFASVDIRATSSCNVEGDIFF